MTKQIAKKHKGIRPTHPIALINWKRSIYIEDYPDSDEYRIWNLRMLNSGCGKILQGDELVLSGCIYCPTCDEYFNEEQWVTATDEEILAQTLECLSTFKQRDIGKDEQSDLKDLYP